MVEIPVGPFTLGTDSGEFNEGPAHKADLPAFMMDKFEVTNVDFAVFVEATGYETYAEKQGRTNWRAAHTEGKDNQDPSYKGTVGIAKVHGNMVLVSPTVYLDDVVRCETNKLNPDLGLGGL
jgi:formylglycine-generating enzyme required for sulfatase activity